MTGTESSSKGKARGYAKLALVFAGILILYLAGQGICTAASQALSLQAAPLYLTNSLAFGALTILAYKKLFHGAPSWCTCARGLIVSAVFSAAAIAFLDAFYALHFCRAFPSNAVTQLLMAAAAGIGEEVLFRGFLFDYISKEASLLRGLIVISVVFGCAHLLNAISGQTVTALYIFNCMTAGFFLCVLYYEYGLVPALIYHISWNAIFNGGNTVESKPLTGIILVIAGLAILLIEEKIKRRPSAITDTKEQIR